MSEVKMTEVVDFFNNMARQGKIMAKAEAVVQALQSAEQRIRDAETITTKARKDAAKIEGEALLAVDRAKAELEALTAKVAEAQAKIPQAGDQAAKIIATANAEAAQIKAAAQAVANDVMAKSKSQRAHFEQEEAAYAARAETARKLAEAEENRLAEIKTQFAKAQRDIKLKMGL